jgi:hypothetical protein
MFCVTFPQILDPNSDVCSQGVFWVKDLTPAPLRIPTIGMLEWKRFVLGGDRIWNCRVKDPYTIEVDPRL